MPRLAISASGSGYVREVRRAHHLHVPVSVASPAVSAATGDAERRTPTRGAVAVLHPETTARVQRSSEITDVIEHLWVEAVHNAR